MAQQFVVPQFIDVEDKIIGPITTRQFLILLAASLMIFLAYRFADFSLFVIITVLVGGIAILFAFVKVNGQQFHYFILNVLGTMRRPGLRIWRKEYNKKELDYLRKRTFEQQAEEEPIRKPVKQQHIQDLSLIVNTGGYYRPIGDIPTQDLH